MTGSPAAGKMPPAMIPRSTWRWLLWTVAAIPILLWAAPVTSLNPRSLLPDMVDGTAHRPYVRRALVPLLARAGETLAGERGRAAATEWALARPGLMDRLGWEPERALAFALVFLLHGLALVGFAAAFCGLARAVWDVGETTAALAAAAAVLLVPLHFGYQNFVYDFPALALFTLGVKYAHERRVAAFTALWPVGLLNKETYLLTAVSFVMRLRRRVAAAVLRRHVLALLAIGAVVGGALVWAFRHNPGGAVEWQLPRNLEYHPGAKQLRRDLAYLLFWAFALVGWRAKRTLVAEAAVIGGVLFVTTFFLGFLGEWRDFYEVFPLGLLLALHTALRFLGREPGLREAESSRTP